MLENLYHYGGAGRPDFVKDVHWYYDLAIVPTMIAMDQDEHDFLSALELMYGNKVEIIHFQTFHDEAWANQKKYTLDSFMSRVCCSIDFLTDLMPSNHGDLRWKRELERRKRAEQRLRCTLPQGIFI